MLVRLRLEEHLGIVDVALHDGAVPRVGGDVGDGVLVAAEEPALGKVAIQHVELALHLHREAVDRVLELLGGVGVEVAEAAAEVRGVLPICQKSQDMHSARAARLLGQEGIELLRQVDQDRSGFEDAGRR